jgi:hypothetical protein
MLLKAGSEMIPDITPSEQVNILVLQLKVDEDVRSYPKSRKPMVAMVDSNKDSGRPESPAYFGGAIVRA